MTVLGVLGRVVATDLDASSRKLPANWGFIVEWNHVLLIKGKEFQSG